MLARAFAVLWLILLSAAAALAQAPPPPEPLAAPPPGLPPPPAAPTSPAGQSGRVFCDQTVDYHLADPASVPDQYRRFVGVWSDAAWDVRTCAALVVEGVQPDGTASIIYVYGPQGSGSAVAGAVLHGTGVIRNGELRFQNSDGSQYAFRPGVVDMTGHWIDPKGASFAATFKATP
jgi:hypothetical protein